MELSCEFGQEYTPSEDSLDPVALDHVRNCPDCQEQVVVLDEGQANWSIDV